MKSVRISLLAAASLSLGLTGATMAQDEAGSDTNLDIVGFEAVGSSLDEEAVREILTGDLSSHAEGLASLDAESITIERIDFFPFGDDERVSFSDIVLAGVVDGVAATVVIGGLELVNIDDANSQYGAMSISELDLGAWLEAAGQVEAGEDEGPVQLFSGLSYSGGRFIAGEGKCAFGPTHLGRLEIRPADWARLAEASSEDEFDEAAFIDIMSSFTLGGMEMDAWACKFLDSDSSPVEMRVGGFSAGEFSPGHWPEISISDVLVSIENPDEAGTVSFGSLTMGAIDYSGVLDLGDIDFDDQSIQAIRQTMPHFSSFSMSDVVLDVPDGSSGDRISFTLETFDLDFGDWFNGLPTRVSYAMIGQTMKIEFGGGMSADDEELLRLLDLESWTNNSSGSLYWDRNTETIALDELSYDWGERGGMTFSANFGNATEALFGFDEDEVLTTLMGLGLSDFSVSWTDSGLFDQFVALIAYEEGEYPETMRTMIAKQLETELFPDLPRELLDPILSFVRDGGSLSFTARSADGAPVPLMAMAAGLESDPFDLFERFDIEASYTPLQ